MTTVPFPDSHLALERNVIEPLVDDHLDGERA
jgi:hypothetical protein